jgi:hypothetical protein
MSLQFKFKNEVDEDRRREIVDVLDRAGFAARSLFPDQKRPRLAAIFTIPDAKAEDVSSLNLALKRFGSDIEYVEASPTRTIKG